MCRLQNCFQTQDWSWVLGFLAISPRTQRLARTAFSFPVSKDEQTFCHAVWVADLQIPEKVTKSAHSIAHAMHGQLLLGWLSRLPRCIDMHTRAYTVPMRGCMLIHARMYPSIHTYEYLILNTHTSTHMHMLYAYTHSCMYTHTHTHTHTRTHTHAHAHAHMHTHTPTHTNVHMQKT